MCPEALQGTHIRVVAHKVLVCGGGVLGLADVGHQSQPAQFRFSTYIQIPVIHRTQAASGRAAAKDNLEMVRGLCASLCTAW